MKGAQKRNHSYTINLSYSAWIEGTQMDLLTRWGLKITAISLRIIPNAFCCLRWKWQLVKIGWWYGLLMYGAQRLAESMMPGATCLHRAENNQLLLDEQCNDGYMKGSTLDPFILPSQNCFINTPHIPYMQQWYQHVISGLVPYRIALPWVIKLLRWLPGRWITRSNHLFSG